MTCMINNGKRFEIVCKMLLKIKSVSKNIFDISYLHGKCTSFLIYLLKK